MSSVNLDKLINRLQSFQSKNIRIWKPQPGTQIVRLVPYKFNPENPFIELQFYYNLAGKTYLSPATFGKPDPILEFCNRLKKTGNKEDWILARKMEPKLRTYAPIIVRGLEGEGVKFWGFGKMVYQEILKIMADPDYGDITDITKGHDLNVEFKAAIAGGKTFPETSVRAKPAKTPAVDPDRKDLVAILNNQTDITNLFTLPEYEDLKQAMHVWLNPEPEEPAVDPAVDAESTEPADALVQATTISPSAEKASTEKGEKVDFSQEFEDFFNKKTS
jgi:hypothetical protein